MATFENETVLHPGCLLAGLSVAMGAFAAHGATKFMTGQQLGSLDKAARYNMYHALALFIVAWAPIQGRRYRSVYCLGRVSHLWRASY